MPDTDRKKLKDQIESELVTTAGISSAKTAVQDVHKRTFHTTRPYAANNAAAFTMVLAVTQRKARLRAVKINSLADITGNATNYQKFTVSSQYANGVAGATLGTWNTHTGAQSTITGNVAVTVSTSTNADSVLAAGDKVLIAMAATGDGWNVAYPGVSFIVDLEEV